MSDEEREVLCTRCPKGCRLKLMIEEDEVVVKGYECKLGQEYGKQEAENPQRVVPTTVKINKARWPRLPVRTGDSVPLDRIEDIIDDVKGISVEAPVKKGDVIVKDVAGTSVSIIAVRDMERVKK